ncbi:hypothetical protein ABZ477_00475 [Microbacterium sp. NPDC019599]|uniref:hypothetical protein n=1 Tax=Microbacterium sp. NPDC019599 TaxID=3154690 RepID=UPI003401D189
MGIDDIWPSLAPETRDWLIANNGDAVPADIAAEIDEALETSGADDVWASGDAISERADAVSDLDDELADEDEDEDDEEFGARYLADEAVDWIEEFANEDEQP